jgi:hypothetical protein
VKYSTVRKRVNARYECKYSALELVSTHHGQIVHGKPIEKGVSLFIDHFKKSSRALVGMQKNEAYPRCTEIKVQEIDEYDENECIRLVKRLRGTHYDPSY